MFKKIIKFGASWCGPCRQQATELGKLKTSHPVLDIEELDVDAEEVEPLLEKYSIKSVPTLVFIYEDDSFIKKNGMHTEKQIEEILGL